MKLFAELADCTPADDLQARLLRNYDRLEEAPYQPPAVFQRERAHEKWPGDIEGRTLLAWVLLAQATGREPMHLDNLLAQWPSETNAEGYFGRIYSPDISEQQLSSHGWVLRALAELERWRPNGPARDLAMPVMDRLFLPLQGAMASYPIDPASRVAAGEWSGSHLRQVGHWILSTDVACFAIGLDGLIDAVLSFQRQDLHPLIEEMIERFLQIDLLAIQAQTHASLTGCRALLRWATFSSNEALAEAAELRYRRFTDFAWTETYANFNWFG